MPVRLLDIRQRAVLFWAQRGHHHGFCDPMQHDLFSCSGSDIWQQIDAPDAEIRFAPVFLDTRTASAYFDELMKAISWRHDKIRVYGKLHDVPRLHQWYGDPGTEYIWSGLIMQPQEWIPPLLQLKTLIERATAATYNSLLANLYRNGDDAVGWHSDDEPEFQGHPTIASLSLGAGRDFILRHKNRADVPQIKITLTHGSLLVMSGRTQQTWQHTVPRRAGVKSQRINLTLRTSVARSQPRQRRRNETA
mgnify:FL=1